MPPGKTGRNSTKPFSGIHLLLKVFRFEAFVNRIAGNSLTEKVQVGVIFDEKYFYRLLSTINSNLLSILLIFDII